VPTTFRVDVCGPTRFFIGRQRGGAVDEHLHANPKTCPKTGGTLPVERILGAKDQIAAVSCGGTKTINNSIEYNHAGQRGLGRGLQPLAHSRPSFASLGRLTMRHRAASTVMQPQRTARTAGGGTTEGSMSSAMSGAKLPYAALALASSFTCESWHRTPFISREHNTHFHALCTMRLSHSGELYSKLSMAPPL
jgi:hypothetical protein